MQLNGRRVMIVHGTDDDFTHPSSSYRLAERARRVNREICRSRSTPTPRLYQHRAEVFALTADFVLGSLQDRPYARPSRTRWRRRRRWPADAAGAGFGRSCGRTPPPHCDPHPPTSTDARTTPARHLTQFHTADPHTPARKGRGAALREPSRESRRRGGRAEEACPKGGPHGGPRSTRPRPHAIRSNTIGPPTTTRKRPPPPCPVNAPLNASSAYPNFSGVSVCNVSNG